MPESTTTKPAKLYKLTVRDAFVGMGTKGTLQLNSMKSITVNPSENTAPIHASGALYDIQTVIGEPQVEVDAVALPREFLDWANGATVSGAASADVSHPEKPIFPFGYVCEMSDHSLAYYYHPRCKLAMGSSEYRTSTNAPVDPSEKCTIHIIPTEGENLWRARYYTRGVTNPMTMKAFFALAPDTLAKVAALDVTAAQNESA